MHRELNKRDVKPEERLPRYSSNTVGDKTSLRPVTINDGTEAGKIDN
jgi:hypothetical protein